MQTISLSNVSFSYDSSNPILDGVSVVFNNSDRVAIVGDNGSGKTTLLKLLAGEISPDSGNVAHGATTYLMRQINAMDAKSGGERQSAELWRAFNSGAAILLLDEPTNNLDSDAKGRFFSELMAYPFGVVVVSHDRELLQKMDRIIEVANGKLRVYGGNYDFYVAQKRAEQAKLESKLNNTENRISRLNKTKIIALDCAATGQKKLGQTRHKAIRCGNHKAMSGINDASDKLDTVLAKKLKLINKKLDEKIQERQQISEAMRDDKIKIPVPNKPFYSKELVQISNLGFGYGTNRVFDGFDFSMYGGQRIRIIGKNGSGKSTLLKIICGDLKPESGTVKTFGKIAYLNQDLSVLDRDKTIVENIMDISDVLKHDAHAIAANFGFRGDASNKRASVLSGGELLKATLAAILGAENQPDLLILDEPTNNLEIKSIAILEDALNQYRGAILLVSHDEIFAKNINVDKTIYIK
ncbi:MAG: ABC-F family ATP-binding cassette domain-containing protein [Alphaproteobacteria bacterium]|nr:ABC-F family ATP-binding cassette domain-containing protein [Alphaproteobacteria bacterium]